VESFGKSNSIESSTMNTVYPLISIVTPSYNQGKYLENTILSVLNQNYHNLEYIIVDGGSTDNSVEIIKKYEKFLKYWISEPDEGQSNAINKGLRHATGDVLTWLNSDDYYMPGALHKVGEAVRANPEAGAFVGIGREVDDTGKVTYFKEPPSEISVQSLFKWYDGGNFMQPSCFFRKAVWDVCGPLDESLHIAMDVDLWLRMAKKNCKFLGITELLSTGLNHPKAKTKAFAKLKLVETAIVIIRHGGEHEVRGRLEDMARKLSWCEPNLRKIINNPVFKIIEPLIRLLVKPAVRWRDVSPPWSTDNSKK
jgi:glycosyltransferase involved in cell wall biosynthesis